MPETMKPTTMHRGSEYNLPHGLDWDRIRAEYQATCTPEELLVRRISGVTEVNTAGDRVAATRKPIHQKDREQPTTVPVALRNQIVTLYVAGAKVPDIAKTMKLTPATVRKWLKRQGVYDDKRDLSRKKED